MNAIESIQRYKEAVRILYLPKEDSLNNPMNGQDTNERMSKLRYVIEFSIDGYWLSASLSFDPNIGNVNKALIMIMNTAPLLGTLISRYEQFERQYFGFLRRKFWALWTTFLPTSESLWEEESSALTSIAKILITPVVKIAIYVQASWNSYKYTSRAEA